VGGGHTEPTVNEWVRYDALYQGRRHYLFTAIGVDKRTPEAGADLFSLTLEYSASQAQGPLFASFEFEVCDATTCTMAFEEPVKRRHILVHTTGGD
jgi:hypothetical protein